MLIQIWIIVFLWLSAGMITAAVLANDDHGFPFIETKLGRALYVFLGPLTAVGVLVWLVVMIIFCELIWFTIVDAWHFVKRGYS